MPVPKAPDVLGTGRSAIQKGYFMPNLKDTTEPSQKHSSIAAKQAKVPLRSLYLIALIVWIWYVALTTHGNAEKLEMRILGKATTGMLVLGILLHMLVIPSRKPDLLVSTAWYISLSLVITWICLIMIGLFGGPYALTYFVIKGMLWSGILVGLGFALVRWIRPVTAIPATQDNTESEMDSAVSPRPGGWGRGFLGFTCGVIISFLIAIFVLYVAHFFRGPIAGVTTLGTTRYENDQGPIKLATALGIMTIGWILGITFIRRRYRGLAVGLIVATTIFGIMASVP
jgi:hypothetical protein